MRLERVRIRGLGPFRDEVKLDMAELGDAMLVAVCGVNGEGKSCFLEMAIPGAFYRQMPTQGSLKTRSKARDSLLEVTVCDGSESYTIRHLVDSISGKGESVVTDHTGRPVFGSTKVSSYDEWATKILPAKEVLLASTFGAQQDRGFLGADPAERSSILLRALGISRYEAWATGAGERARQNKQALEITRARLDEAIRTGGDVSLFSTAFEAAKEEASRLDGELAAAKVALADLELRVREAETASAAHAAHVAKQVELRARVQTLEGKRADLEVRIAACNSTLAQEDSIREAAAKLEGLREQMNDLTQYRTTLGSRLETARERQRSAQASSEESRKHWARVSSRITALEDVVKRGAEITQAEADLREVEAGLVTLREGVTTAQAALDELTATAVTGAESRIVVLRGGLEFIPETLALDAAHDAARRCLKADDLSVLAASERPAKLAAARQRLQGCRDGLAAFERRQQQLIALARRAGELTAAKDQIASLKAELAQHADAIRTQEAETKEAAAHVQSFSELLEDHGKSHRALNDQADKLKPLADQLPNIAVAASKLEERKAQLSEVAGELEAATWAVTQLGPAPAPVAVPDVSAQREKLAAVETSARTAAEAVAVASSKLESARATETKVCALRDQQRTDENELADWTRLAEDLGRKGLQAAEIDGCGPRLTVLVNDLLHVSHGPRYTVRIDTQKLSSDGKKTLESGPQVTVIDSVKGHEDEGRLFSGGERVIIGEAMALGLSMLACQRSGIKGITLVRDETVGACDPGNAEVYIKMLRRAAEQIGADRVFFVAHSKEVSDLADARITIANGKLVVDAQAGRAMAAARERGECLACGYAPCACDQT